MVDPQVVVARLAIIEQNVADLQEYQSLTFAEFIATTHNYWSVQYGLLLTAQAVVDIATHIVSDEIGQSLEYYAAIEALSELKILPPRFAKSFAEVAKFRNLIVHEYMKVDLSEVYSILQNDLDDFLMFAGYINRWLESKFPTEPPK